MIYPCLASPKPPFRWWERWKVECKEASCKGRGSISSYRARGKSTGLSDAKLVFKHWRRLQSHWWKEQQFKVSKLRRRMLSVFGWLWHADSQFHSNFGDFLDRTSKFEGFSIQDLQWSHSFKGPFDEAPVILRNSIPREGHLISQEQAFGRVRQVKPVASH